MSAAASAQHTPHVGVEDDDGGEAVVDSQLPPSPTAPAPRGLYYLETYGCAMNTADSELVASVLQSAGMARTDDVHSASLIAVNTCAIRENAEAKVWQRLHVFRAIRTPTSHFKRVKTLPSSSSPPSSRPLVAVLGCMAERLKDKLLDHDGLVDLVVGPDAYRDLPRLIDAVQGGSTSTAMNVQLSLDETYADIAPVRGKGSGVSAFVSIMRGCDNLCSYCIVPFTRGHERSRDSASIVDEVRRLSDEGYREVTLLGQNVNSWRQTEERRLSDSKAALTSGFVNISRRPVAQLGFTDLLDAVSRVDPEMRIRYTSPHPKDVPTEMLQLIRERPNICKQIHLPAQSGSSAVLQRMRRGYTREAYLQLIDAVRHLLPSASVSTDLISGFCGETEAEHEETLSLMEAVAYDQAFMFAFSQREKTHAHRTMADDVPQEVKMRRLQEVIDTFHRCVRAKNEWMVGSLQLLLVEGAHRRYAEHLVGRTDGNRQASFAKVPLPCYSTSPTMGGEWRVPGVGEYVAVEVLQVSSTSFRCRGLGWTTLSDFSRLHPEAAMVPRIQVHAAMASVTRAMTQEVQQRLAVQLQ